MTDGRHCGTGALTRREFLKTAGAGLAVATLGFPSIVRAATGARRVVVLGIDGMDPVLTGRYMAGGLLPNITRLAASGTFMPLRTSDPPQSPVAWSTFISGTNPGGHGVFDFISRDPASLTPFFSTARIEGSPRTVTIAGRKIPVGSRKMVNLRKGPEFWSDLEEHGIECTVLRVPANFPPSGRVSKALSGLGTPDIHGSYGIFTLFTDRRGETSRDLSGGRIERVQVRQNLVNASLKGPSNTFDPDGKSVEIPFTVHIDQANPSVLVSIQGRELVLREGGWSDWIQVRFKLIPAAARVAGICRFHLIKARDDFSLYVSPVNMDPVEPAMPISSPPGYSRELASVLGRFSTQGIAEDTSARSTGVFTDAAYREQALFVLKEQERLFDYELGRFKSGFFFSYFSSLDLNSHMFWRAMDPLHPLYTKQLADEQGDFLPSLYRKMDDMVGKAMELLDGRTSLFVISDHGFGSFRRQFNLNSWLMANGYAQSQPHASGGTAPYFADADWSGTRAYGLGINSLYLNVKGREPDGIVAPGDGLERLAQELKGRLEAFRDPASGDRVISRVCRPSELYKGPFAGSAPDLIVLYGSNYRASWDTILGKYPSQVVLNNDDPWSGDHTVDSTLVPGVIVSNRYVSADSPGLEDMAPTILAEFGVPVSPGMTGKNVV